MTIDKPSLAALLAQANKAKANGDDTKESTRPFILKDPKAIVKELMGPDTPKADEDEEYIHALLKSEEPEEEFSFAGLTPENEEETPDKILKRIMGGQ